MDGELRHLVQHSLRVFVLSHRLSDISFDYSELAMEVSPSVRMVLYKLRGSRVFWTLVFRIGFGLSRRNLIPDFN